jgi:predicted RNase H-like nuclease
VVGVDGIRGGWLLAIKQGREVTLERAIDFAAVLNLADRAEAIAIDMPIGLLEVAVRGGRECDRLARERLERSKKPCVFPSPCRPALLAKTHAEACAISRASSRERLGVSRQCFGLFEKLRDLDRVMTPRLQRRCFEVHPEVSFTALRDAVAPGDPTLAPLQKKSDPPGHNQRITLLQWAGWIGENDLVRRGRALGAEPDDVLDACVAAWTAERIAQGDAKRVPSNPPKDARGLRMEIWF